MLIAPNPAAKFDPRAQEAYPLVSRFWLQYVERYEMNENDKLAFLATLVSSAFPAWQSPVLMDQSRINLFAQATGDDQWIHVDEERAKRESPYGSTIAHGFHTLALIAATQKVLFDTVQANYPAAIVIHESGSYRFRNAVRCGAEVCSRGRIASMERDVRKPMRRASLVYAYETSLVENYKIAVEGTMSFIFMTR